MTEEKGIWSEMPDIIPEGFYYRVEEIDEFHEKLKAKIMQVHECLGMYESKEWCGHCLIDAACGRITMELNKLKTVNAHLDAVYKDKSVLDKWTWSINPIAFDKLMANLYKSLGVKL